MERKRPAIQGNTDFGLSGHPYSAQVLLPVSSANICSELTYPKILILLSHPTHSDV